MKKVFIIHGFMSSPNGGFRPWLMAELFKNDVYACALPMPDPYHPKKEAWVEAISNAVNMFPEDEIILVGHSLGVPAILRYLQTLSENQKIIGSVLVSGPCYSLDIENKETKLRRADNFLDIPFDFENIKQKSKQFVVIHGDNDPKVPFSHAIEISQKLDCKLVSIPNGKHLGNSDGCFELPEVFTAIKDML